MPTLKDKKINHELLKALGYPVHALMDAYQASTNKKIELTETSMEEFIDWVKVNIPEALKTNTK